VQERAVRHPGGPLLVLAGAGSGKTRVLTHRIAFLIAEAGVSPLRILAVTFTNKAAGEMKRRVVDLVGAGADATWIGTFHSICARVLRREARWGWWTPSFTIYDERDQTDLVKECMERAGVSVSTFAPRAVLSAISRSKDRLLTAAAARAEASDYFGECAAKVYEEYERRLRRNNALDFDDLIMRTVELLRGTTQVLDAYAGRFEHVLVDEYQDTSHAQYALVSLLSSRHRNVCVVGDDDQSIYGWRGADISNILDFEKDHPDAVVLRMEQNYRSTKSILEASHDVVSRNTRRKDKKLWTERPQGRRVALHRVSNEYEEADAVRDAVLAGLGATGRSPRDFAVLYRTHAQSRVIEDSLRRAGVAYDIVGGVRFYERAEVKDALAYLKVIANPADSVSLRRIVNTPPRRVGERTIEKLEALAAERGVPLLEALRDGGELPDVAVVSRKALAGLSDLLARLVARAGTARVDDVLREVVDASGYRAWLERQATDEARERLANVEELVSAAGEFVESSGEGGVAAFLEQVSLVSDIDLWEDRANAVSLMTLHNAKGLEFTVVLIPGLEEGHDARQGRAAPPRGGHEETGRCARLRAPVAVHRRDRAGAPRGRVGRGPRPRSAARGRARAPGAAARGGTPRPALLRGLLAGRARRGARDARQAPHPRRRRDRGSVGSRLRRHRPRAVRRRLGAPHLDPLRQARGAARVTAAAPATAAGPPSRAPSRSRPRP
jgi:DNA helicase-2/ATP-dependent DNA helicase PcrA